MSNFYNLTPPPVTNDDPVGFFNPFGSKHVSYFVKGSVLRTSQEIPLKSTFASLVEFGSPFAVTLMKAPSLVLFKWLTSVISGTT